MILAVIAFCNYDDLDQDDGDGDDDDEEDEDSDKDNEEDDDSNNEDDDNEEEVDSDEEDEDDSDEEDEDEDSDDQYNHFLSISDCDVFSIDEDSDDEDSNEEEDSDDEDFDDEDSNDEDLDKDYSNNESDDLSHDSVASSLECLRTQLRIVRRLIVVLGPQFQVSYSPVSHPDFRETTTLQGCIGRTVVFCRFCFVDIPSVEELNFLCTDSLLGGFRFAL